MKAIVLNKQGQKIDELKGSVKDGMFTYTKGKFLGLFGGHKEEEECDYDMLVPVYWSILFGLLKGSYRCIYYEYKNSRLTQLSWREVAKTSVFSDANNAWKQMTYAEEATLKRPSSGLENLMPWILMFEVIIAVAAIALVANNSANKISSAYAPIQNQTRILQGQAAFLQSNQNYTNSLLNNTDRVLNKCLVLLSNKNLS